VTAVDPARGLVDDAVAAELATGRREPTRATALAAVAARVARISAGGALLLVGVLLLVLPGPGLPILLAGLLLLARDVAWAARLAERVRGRIAVVPERARRPALVAAVVGALVVSLLAAGAAF
jgi:hypothetical protein